MGIRVEKCDLEGILSGDWRRNVSIFLPSEHRRKDRIEQPRSKERKPGFPKQRRVRIAVLYHGPYFKGSMSSGSMEQAELYER